MKKSQPASRDVITSQISYVGLSIWVSLVHLGTSQSFRKYIQVLKVIISVSVILILTSCFSNFVPGSIDFVVIVVSIRKWSFNNA